MNLYGFIGVTIVAVLLFLFLKYGTGQKIVYVPEYIPVGPPGPRPKPTPSPSKICNDCKFCGKLGAKGYCCASPKNYHHKSICIPDLNTKHKCDKSNNKFSEFQYSWCKGAPRPHKKKGPHKGHEKHRRSGELPKDQCSRCPKSCEKPGSTGFCCEPVRGVCVPWSKKTCEKDDNPDYLWCPTKKHI